MMDEALKNQSLNFGLRIAIESKFLIAERKSLNALVQRTQSFNRRDEQDYQTATDQNGSVRSKLASPLRKGDFWKKSKRDFRNLPQEELVEGFSLQAFLAIIVWTPQEGLSIALRRCCAVISALFFRLLEEDSDE
jgi:hypothetical protein